MTAGHRSCAEERRTGIGLGYTCKNPALGQQDNKRDYKQTQGFVAEKLPRVENGLVAMGKNFDGILYMTQNGPENQG